jgi:hypothetical protein
MANNDALQQEPQKSIYDEKYLLLKRVATTADIAEVKIENNMQPMRKRHLENTSNHNTGDQSLSRRAEWRVMYACNYSSY